MFQRTTRRSRPPPAPARERPATPGRTPKERLLATTEGVCSTQVSLEHADGWEHHDRKERKKDADSSRDQHMVERPPALSDELAPLTVPEVCRQRSHAVHDAGPELATCGEYRRQACQRRDAGPCRRRHQACFERSRARDLRGDEEASNVGRELSLDLRRDRAQRRNRVPATTQ